MASVQVAIRIRPLLSSEEGSPIAVHPIRRGMAVINGKNRTEMVGFDNVLAQETSQTEVYAYASPLVQSVLQGVNATILAYGQTGTGKTFTMDGGNDAQRGVMWRAAEELFGDRDGEGKAATVVCRYVEVYKERVYDLLQSGEDEHPPSVDIREDPVHGVCIPSARCQEVSSVSAMRGVLEEGSYRRAVAASFVHERSSRSHAVFQVEVVRGDRRGVLNMVDLAGSEKWQTAVTSAVDPRRFREMTAINHSLSTLAHCIATLARNPTGHIPFRDSQLTRLLQDSIAGNSRTLFIATISPSSLCASETLSTLKFCARAQRVRTNPRVNSADPTQAMQETVSRLKAELASVRSENARLKRSNRQQDGARGRGEEGEPVKDGERIKDVEEREREVRRREAEVSRYHSWLQGIVVKSNKDGQYSIDLDHALEFMQKTVSQQRGEVERIKNSFEEDSRKLGEQRDALQRRVEELEGELENERQVNREPSKQRDEVLNADHQECDGDEHKEKQKDVHTNTLSKGNRMESEEPALGSNSDPVMLWPIVEYLDDALESFETTLKEVFHRSNLYPDDTRMEDVDHAIETCCDGFRQNVMQHLRENNDEKRIDPTNINKEELAINTDGYQPKQDNTDTGVIPEEEEQDAELDISQRLIDFNHGKEYVKATTEDELEDAAAQYRCAVVERAYSVTQSEQSVLGALLEGQRCMQRTLHTLQRGRSRDGVGISQSQQRYMVDTICSGRDALIRISKKLKFRSAWNVLEMLQSEEKWEKEFPLGRDTK
eukprot:gb/GECH01011383.1/.p1 GENE.gb/GECH01011383.1/~~gb/GECH01011383.1/.p1  ORF type:complete len:774 (+),score=141.44 gb/GECH01011383.1/:1-2322(+)